MSVCVRYFFAIDFPDMIKQKISAYIEELKQELSCPIKWVNVLQLHLTLRFIGALTQEQLLQLTNHFSMPTPKLVLALTATKLILLGKPNIIAIGIQSTLPLTTLVSELESELSHFGFKPETRDFNPHITLGRFKNEMAAIPEIRTELILPTYEVQKVGLYRSQSTSEGSLYTLIKEYSLAAS